MAIPVAGVLAALQIVDGLIARIGSVNAVIKGAQQAGRDVTPEELDKLMAADDAARAKLVAAIAAARANKAPGS